MLPNSKTSADAADKTEAAKPPVDLRKWYEVQTDTHTHAGRQLGKGAKVKLTVEKAARFAGVFKLATDVDADMPAHVEYIPAPPPKELQA